MKATLTFDLDNPEDRDRHSDALNGAAWKGVVTQFDEWLRNKIKYTEESDWADEARRVLRECIIEDGLSID